MKKVLKTLITLFLVASIIFVAGCSSKVTTITNSTLGVQEQVTPVGAPTTGMQSPIQEAQVVGLFIEFEDGTTEPEVRAIVENYDLKANYTIDYNCDLMPKRCYIIVDKDKRMDIKDELRKGENWTDPAYRDIKK